MLRLAEPVLAVSAVTKLLPLLATRADCAVTPVGTRVSLLTKPVTVWAVGTKAVLPL